MSEEDRLLLEQVHDYVKWPRLLVVGEPVTQEQANEIIVRTTPLHYIGTNDDAWAWQVKEALGLRLELDLTHDDYRPEVSIEQRLAKLSVLDAHIDARKAALGTLDLYYLGNGEQIASCYFAGPHGWCAWDGQIGASSYNIGKWPTPEEVHSDVVEIAEAFPFLTMTVQVLGDHYVPDSTGSDDAYGSYVADETAPVTWHIKGGQVEVDVAPRPPITEPTDPEMDEKFMMWRFSDPHAERGVTVERLREAVAQVERARAEEVESSGD